MCTIHISDVRDGYDVHVRCVRHIVYDAHYLCIDVSIWYDLCIDVSVWYDLCTDVSIWYTTELYL